MRSIEEKQYADCCLRASDALESIGVYQDLAEVSETIKSLCLELDKWPPDKPTSVQRGYLVVSRDPLPDPGLRVYVFAGSLNYECKLPCAKCHDAGRVDCCDLGCARCGGLFTAECDFCDGGTSVLGGTIRENPHG